MVNRGKGHRCDTCHETWTCFQEYCTIPDHTECDKCYIHRLRQKKKEQLPKTGTVIRETVERHPLNDK